VLALDESNQAATDGLRNISDILVANARAATDQGKTSSASRALEQATQAMPSGANNTMASGVQPKKSSSLGLILGLIVVAAIGAGAAWKLGYIGQPPAAPVPPQAAAPVQNGVDAKIDQLLADAQTAFSAGHYLSPTGNNAFQKYQAVLALDESNQAATDGLRNISDILVANARAATDQGKTSSASRALEQATQAGGTAGGDCSQAEKTGDQGGQGEPAAGTARRSECRATGKDLEPGNRLPFTVAPERIPAGIGRAFIFFCETHRAR